MCILTIIIIDVGVWQSSVIFTEQYMYIYIIYIIIYKPYLHYKRIPIKKKTLNARNKQWTIMARGTQGEYLIQQRAVHCVPSTTIIC